MIRFASLASGSEANATFISTSRTRILIDDGLSLRELRKRMAAIGERVENLDAVFVTHEHGDHIDGVPRLLKERRRKSTTLPAYMTAGTFGAFDWKDCPDAPVEQFQPGSCVQVKDISVQSFTVPHDAADPVAYTVIAEGVKIGVITDLGFLPEAASIYLSDCHTLLLESNHDLEMLKVGPYPFSVKQRVMGRNGHLSNLAVSKFIRSQMNVGLQNLILAHISTNNNDRALVEMNAIDALASRGLAPSLAIARQHYGEGEPIPVIEL